MRVLSLSAEASPLQLRIRIFKWLKDSHPLFFDGVVLQMMSQLVSDQCSQYDDPLYPQGEAWTTRWLHLEGISERVNCLVVDLQ